MSKSNSTGNNSPSSTGSNNSSNSTTDSSLDGYFSSTDVELHEVRLGSTVPAKQYEYKISKPEPLAYKEKKAVINGATPVLTTDIQRIIYFFASCDYSYTPGYSFNTICDKLSDQLKNYNLNKVAKKNIHDLFLLSAEMMALFPNDEPISAQYNLPYIALKAGERFTISSAQRQNFYQGWKIVLDSYGLAYDSSKVEIKSTDNPNAYTDWHPSKIDSSNRSIGELHIRRMSAIIRSLYYMCCDKEAYALRHYLLENYYVKPTNPPQSEYFGSDVYKYDRKVLKKVLGEMLDKIREKVVEYRKLNIPKKQLAIWTINGGYESHTSLATNATLFKPIGHQLSGKEKELDDTGLGKT